MDWVCIPQTTQHRVYNTEGSGGTDLNGHYQKRPWQLPKVLQV